MPLTAEKRALIASFLGEEETDKMLDRLTQLEAELKAAGVEYKEAGTAQAGDVLAELLIQVESGQTTIEAVRKEVGPEVADVLERVAKGRKVLTRSKDVPATLDGIRATIADVTERVAKLDADAKAAEAEKDAADPISKFARMLSGKKGKKEVKLEDDGHPAHRYAKKLFQGQVEREGG